MDDDRPSANGAHHPHGHAPEELVEALARTVAHLAAQLTITQLRLRALATALDGGGVVDAAAVRSGLRALAERSAGPYLEENLGEALADVVDVDALAEQIRAFVARE